MATTKTIQPTGTTITVPAMTDAPNMSVVATDIDRITDAANQLNTIKANIAQSYGTNLSWTVTGSQSVLVISNYYLVLVWTPSTTDISILVINSSGAYTKSGSGGSVSFGATSSDSTYTLSRSGSTVTVSSSSNQSYKVFT